MKLFSAHYDTGFCGSDGSDIIIEKTKELADEVAWEMAKDNADQYDTPYDEEEYESVGSCTVEITNKEEFEDAQSTICGSPSMIVLCERAIKAGYKEPWLLEAKVEYEEEHRAFQIDRLTNTANELKEKIKRAQKELEIVNEELLGFEV